MSITITDAAKEKIAEALGASPLPDPHFAIRVIGGGCSGFSYDFHIIESIDEQYKSFDFGEVSVFVDRKSYLFLSGTEIDYSESLFKSGFIINNPNAKRSCGCGESFSV